MPEPGAAAARPAATGIRGNPARITWFTELPAGKPFGVGRVKVDHQPHQRLRRRNAAADPEPANFDQSRQFVAPAEQRAGRRAASDGRGHRRSAAVAGICPARPARMRSNARRDLPDPDGPRISTARSPTSTAEAWMLAPCAASYRGQPDHEARAGDAWHRLRRRLGPGRFSAQMRPPWASMICLEIDRPNPEFCPKPWCGRSV